MIWLRLFHKVPCKPAPIMTAIATMPTRVAAAKALDLAPTRFWFIAITSVKT